MSIVIIMNLNDLRQLRCSSGVSGRLYWLEHWMDVG